ncbi:polyketide cyclase [Actinophytocola sp.]|uniref:polyketide cyclase n=1 Tax=Actinophytocola sp. TaxID=1872138 RepID=UPI00389A8C96
MVFPGEVWGATAEERAAKLPCDDIYPDGLAADRAVSVDAPPSLVWAWLCQIRLAPYSYDWLDNFGKRSPRERTPELVDLEVGQRFMRLFTLACFERDDHVTISNKNVATTYAVRPEGTGTRLVARTIFNGPNAVGRPLGMVDWIMMRKQLLNIKAHAEREHATITVS